MSKKLIHLLRHARLPREDDEARYMHIAWKKHQITVYWVDINLALKKGLKFYQTRSNATILHETLPAYCIPKVVRMEIGDVIYEKVYSSLKHEWMKDLGSEVAGQPEGEVARQAKSSQSSQSNPNTDHDRTGRPVVCSERASQTRFSRDSPNFNLEEETNHDRTERPAVCSQSERSMLNEFDIDIRISELPHSVVKQAENFRVRELVKQIENHPHQEALRQDLQQKEAYNPFSTMTKQMIQDVDNV